MKILASSAALALAYASLIGASAVPASAATPQEAAETKPPLKPALGDNYKTRLAKLPVIESLTHVHNVLGQAVHSVPGVELTGPRFPEYKAPLTLPPSVKSGSALSHAQLMAVQVESFEGTDVPATDELQAHQRVSLELSLKLAPGANAPMAADMLGLVLASSGRISLAAQSPIAAVADRPDWYQLSLEIRCAPSKAWSAEEPPAQLDAAAAPKAHDAMPMYLRTIAQNEQVKFGKLIVKAPEVDANGVKTWQVTHRFEGVTEISRTLRFANFFSQFTSNSKHASVVSFRSERAPDGAWSQTFTVR